MTIWQRLDPRLHLAAAIGWAVFAVVTLAALATAGLAAGQAEQRARTDAEGLLAEFATQVRDALSMSLELRQSVMRSAAGQVSATSIRDAEALRSTLLATQTQFPEFVWLGVADTSGRIVAETGHRWLGADVSSLAWLQQGRQRPFVSDTHAEPERRSAQHGLQPGPAPHLIDVAVPLPEGGTLAAFMPWSWLEQHLIRMQQVFSKNRPVELMIAARDGTILFGPPDWLGRTMASDQAATDGGGYVVGSRAHLRLADGLGLGWTAIVRQPAGQALAPARTTRRIVFLVVFSAGLMAAALAALATQLLTRRLTQLAREAEAVRRGDSRSLVIPAGTDEVSRIGATLAEVVDRLQSEKQALQTLNTELDLRVADRTRRIERMADGARHAAVTRERLRIARDLHDTLAHSLMALLTQIRLVRKLRGRMGVEELDAELGRAEDVATTGLSGARSAIAQMRDNDVRDSGLGPALQNLAGRFRDRCGMVVSLTVDEVASALTDERAETVFRIVEEALRNVERHADAQEVRILLSATEVAGGTGRISVEVADDGIGFDPTLPRPGHFGLRGVREQAALIGAGLDIQSGPGKGTRIALAFQA